MVLEKYKETLINTIQLYYPVSREELSPIVDYSINKRYKESPVIIENSYTKESDNNFTLLALTDWIMSKEPIITANGVMFKKHSEVPNPLAIVIQQFLDARSMHKKQMFKFPKGTEDFEKYNLMQSLTKMSRALI